MTAAYPDFGGSSCFTQYHADGACGSVDCPLRSNIFAPDGGDVRENGRSDTPPEASENGRSES